MAAKLMLTGDHDRLVACPAFGEAARLSIPANEHCLPLLCILGLRQPDEPVPFFER